MEPVVVEVATWTADPDAAHLSARLQTLARRATRARFADLYLALPPDRPDEEPGPRVILHLGFGSERAARAFLDEAETKQALAGSAKQGHTLALFQRRDFPVAGATAKLAAPFSYVVRYRLPAEDPEGFRAYYMRMHPPILARFPGIRNVFCYVPLPIADAVLPSPGWLIGNEVAFDDRAAFEAAMASPVREEARADGRTFPPYSGKNHHWPMARTRLWSAPET